jgi:hypothetical protein
MKSNSMMEQYFLVATAAVLALSPTHAAAQISVVSETTMEREAHQGERYEGTILVRNDSPAPQEVTVYQTDYQFFADGRTLYPRPASTARSNSAWISFAPSHLVIPPHTTVPVAYAVTVPAGGPVLAGSFWSMLMVEGMAITPAASVQSPKAGERRMGVRVAIRYGTQVITHVGSSGRTNFSFIRGRIVGAAGRQRSLAVDIVNSGERAHRVALTLRVFDATGKSVVTMTTQRGMIYPDCSFHQELALPALPPGRYKALLEADAGGDEVFGAQYTLNL